MTSSLICLSLFSYLKNPRPLTSDLLFAHLLHPSLSYSVFVHWFDFDGRNLDRVGQNLNLNTNLNFPPKMDSGKISQLSGHSVPLALVFHFMGPARKRGRREEMEIKATVKQRDRRRVLFVTIACIIGSTSSRALCVTAEPKNLRDLFLE